MRADKEEILMSNSMGKTGTAAENTHLESKQQLAFSKIDDANIKPILTNRALALVATLSFFLVFAHWNVFDIGQYSAGLNTSIFYAGFLYLLYKNNVRFNCKDDWYWLVPISLIVISFSLFENPWLKLISLFILPLSIGIFYHYSQLPEKKYIPWGKQLIAYTALKSLQVFSYFKPSKQYWIKQIPKGDNNKRKQIVKGITILIPALIAVTVLLSSADENFAALVGPTFDFLLSMDNVSFLFRVFTSLVFAIFLLAIFYSWRLPPTFTFKVSTKPSEDIVYGILMSGILILYFAFLYLQFEYLLVNSLPADFSQTEHLVKSGFWQLFFLSVINVLLFIGIYKKTSAFVQHILRLYIFASGLILLSACWRIFLYVKWYGFSYEKYFAAYTCIFALLTFAYLLWASFAKTKKDIVRFLAFSMLWTYAIATVSPIEKIIYNTNHYLFAHEDTRIDLNQLKSLSADVLGNVENDVFNGDLKPEEWQVWRDFIHTNRCNNRHWYESNLSLMINCR